MCPEQSGGFLPTTTSGKSAGEVWSQGDLKKYQKRESQKLLLLWVFFFFFSFIYKCEKALFSTKKNSQPRWQGTADNGSDTRGMAFEQSVVWVIM